MQCAQDKNNKQEIVSPQNLANTENCVLTVTTTRYFLLPYVKNLCEKLTKIFRNDNINTKIVYKSANILYK